MNELLGRLIGAPLFLTFFPWVVLAVVLAIAGLLLTNAGLRLDVAMAESRYQALKVQHAKLEAEANAFALAVAEREAALAREHRARMLEIETRYRKELHDANQSSGRLAADLRAERGIRVRAALNCAARPDGVPDPGASGPGADGAADDPAAIVARVDRIGAEADARIRALQAVIQADRARINADRPNGEPGEAR